MNNNLSNVLGPVGVLGILTIALIMFTRVLTDYILKKKMIEKGYVNDDAQSIFKKQSSVDNKYSSLKWGLIIFFAGFGLVTIEYIPHDPQSPMPYGLFTLSVSLGFLIYYFIVRKELDK